MPGPEAILPRVEELRRTYTVAETLLMQRVARRLARGITEAGWTEAKLAQVALIRRDLERVVARLQTTSASQLGELLEAAYIAGSESALEVVGGEPLRAQLVRTNVAALRALYAQTVGELSLANMSILRSTLDAYRAVIAEATQFGVGGVLTRREVAQRALDRWADAGISGFVDRAGRRWELGSYAEMASRTAMTRSHLEGRLQMLQQAGYHEFRVSDSPEECPWCRPWEGKVLADGPNGQGLPTIDEARAAGLFHANCGHTLNLHTPGTERLFRRPVADPSGYESRQQQRYLEREVRRWKRREATAITPEAATKARAHIRTRQAQLRGLGRRRQYDRESITATGRRTA